MNKTTSNIGVKIIDLFIIVEVVFKYVGMTQKFVKQVFAGIVLMWCRSYILLIFLIRRPLAFPDNVQFTPFERLS